MPAPDFQIKTGDTTPRLDATLRNSGGTPVSVQGATVLFKVAPLSGGTLTVGGTAVIDQIGDGSDGSKGQVHYLWPSAFQTSGVYLGEFEVTYLSGAIETFPNDRSILVGVTSQLGT